MGRRRSIAPENQVGYMIEDLKKAAKSNNTKPSGSKYISSGNSITSENTDGEQIVVTDGEVKYFNETIPPVPSAPLVQADLKSVVAGWDGTFANPADTVPSDWSHINVYADGNKVGEIHSATRGYITFASAVDSTHVVTLRAVDKAGNFSEPSVGASVTVSGVDVDTSELEARLTATEGVADSAQATLSNWASPTDTTVIDGGKIATGSIKAEHISLGDNVNMVPNGKGEAHGGWEEFGYVTDLSEFTGTPQDAQGAFTAYGVKEFYSKHFQVSGLTSFTYSYWFLSKELNCYHRSELFFYDINGAICGSVNMGQHAPTPNVWTSIKFENQVAPGNAVTARVKVTHNAIGAIGTTYFTDFKLLTGVKTMLTASGYSSYNGSTQTVRINGVDNLLIGDFISGREGIEPYAKISSRTNVAAMDFYPSPNGANNHGGIWWNEGDHTDGLDWGELHIYAMNDEPTTEIPLYAAGMKFTANGQVEFKGAISPNSETIKGGTLTWSTGLAANSYYQGEVVYAKAFPSHLSFDQIAIQLTGVSGDKAQVFGVVTARATTGFSYRLYNSSGFGAGATRMSWNAFRVG